MFKTRLIVHQMKIKVDVDPHHVPSITAPTHPHQHGTRNTMTFNNVHIQVLEMTAI